LGVSGLEKRTTKDGGGKLKRQITALEWAISWAHANSYPKEEKKSIPEREKGRRKSKPDSINVFLKLKTASNPELT